MKNSGRPIYTLVTLQFPSWIVLRTLVLSQISLCATFELASFTRNGLLPSVFLHMLPQVPFVFTLIMIVRTPKDRHFTILVHLRHVLMFCLDLEAYIFGQRSQGKRGCCLPLVCLPTCCFRLSSLLKDLSHMVHG